MLRDSDGRHERSLDVTSQFPSESSTNENCGQEQLKFYQSKVDSREYTLRSC